MSAPPHVISVDQFVTEYGAHADSQAAALFVGAGLSKAAGYPDWSGLVGRYAGELAVQLPDLALLVQYYEDASADGADRVRADIIASVRDTPAEPTEAHRRLLALPVPDIWTTNYDELIERAAEGGTLDAQVFAEDDDLVRTQPVSKRIYKMHGSIGAAHATSRLVISRDDFDRYPETHPRFWQLMRATFLTRSFLFLGFSLTDPNITEICRLARLYTATSPRPHYAILKREIGDDARLAELRQRDLARAGVRIVEIAEYDELLTALGRLVARCRPPCLYLSGSVVEAPKVAEWTHRFSTALARRLADAPDVRLMTGGVTGADVGYEMSRLRHGQGSYHADDFVVMRRVRDEELTPPRLRWGSVLFDGEEAEFLRSAAFERVRAVVVLGGGTRTRAEIHEALALGLGVIAVGGTGGVASEQWSADMTALGAYRLGERKVDDDALAALGGEDPEAAAAAAVGLIRQALFLA